MSLRDIKKQKTNKALREAIDRIVAKKPNTKELQDRKDVREGKSVVGRVG